MSLNAKTARRLVTAAERFHALRLWKTVEPDETLMLAVPGEEQPLAICVMGQEGMEYGLALFPGGLADLARILEEEPGALDEVPQLSITMSPLRDIPNELRGVLEAARWRGLRETRAPCCLSKPAGRFARSPRNREARVMLYAISALIHAHEAGTLAPRPLDDPDGVPLLELSGKPHAPEIAFATHPPLAPHAPRDALDLDLPPRADLQATGDTWRVGLFDVPGGIAGEDRMPRTLLVVDAATGAVLHPDIVLGDDLDAAAHSLARHVADKAALPARILFAHRTLHELAGPAFEERGVACVYEPDQPDLDAVAGHLAAAMGDAEGAADAPEHEQDREWEAWHAADQQVGELTNGMLGTTRAVIERALTRYFTSRARARQLLQRPDSEFLMTAFGAWRALCYRSRRNAHTALERLLKNRRLTGRVRALAEAMRDARPSLLLIEELAPPLVIMRDVLTDQRHEVTDHGLSATAPTGLLIPGLVYPAGPFTFITVIGDFVNRVQATELFDVLESQGIPVTPEGLAEHSYFGGRIADWKAKRAARGVTRPRVVNFDGDPVLMHTAEFSMRDPRAVARRLDARADVDYDEHEGCWIWNRENPPDRRKPGEGDATLLGRLEMFGDRLVLEVNSERRMHAARAWLDKLPGVDFLDVQTREVDTDMLPRDDLPPMGGSDAPDDAERDDEPSPAEMVEILLKIHGDCLRRWADESVPALGGKTPRQACRTKAGRHKVEFMLRTWPKPSDQIPEDRHRALLDELRADLGLG